MTTAAFGVGWLAASAIAVYLIALAVRELAIRRERRMIDRDSRPWRSTTTYADRLTSDLAGEQGRRWPGSHGWRWSP